MWVPQQRLSHIREVKNVVVQVAREVQEAGVLAVVLWHQRAGRFWKSSCSSVYNRTWRSWVLSVKRHSKGSSRREKLVSESEGNQAKSTALLLCFFIWVPTSKCYPHLGWVFPLQIIQARNSFMGVYAQCMPIADSRSITPGIQRIMFKLEWSVLKEQLDGPQRNTQKRVLIPFLAHLQIARFHGPQEHVECTLI